MLCVCAKLHTPHQICSRKTRATTSPVSSSCGRWVQRPGIQEDLHWQCRKALTRFLFKIKRWLAITVASKHHFQAERRSCRLLQIFSKICNKLNKASTIDTWIAAKLPKYQVQPMQTLSESNGMKFLCAAASDGSGNAANFGKNCRFIAN